MIYYQFDMELITLGVYNHSSELNNQKMESQMKTKTLAKALILLALSLPLTTMAQNKNECPESAIDAGVVTCYHKFENARMMNVPATFITAYQMLLGQDVARCLVNEGIKVKVRPSMDSAEIMDALGAVSLESLSEFNENVSALLKR